MTAKPDIPTESNQNQVVQVEPLRQLLKQMFVKKGMFAPEAQVGADRLVEAELRGIHAHGSQSIGRYLTGMDDGHIDARAQIITERETAAIAVLNGGMGLGHVAATKAMQLAVAKAKDVGTGTVVVKRSQNFGAAAVYAMLAVEAGVIGYCTTNSGPATVPLPGSHEPASCSAPSAWAVPSRNGAPFVLDDLACDAAIQGSGLDWIASVLAGPLSGARMPLQKTSNAEADGSEHFFYAIDIQQLVDPEKFYNHFDASLSSIRELKPADGFDRVHTPGELESARANQWTTAGIPLPREHVANLKTLATNLKLDFTL